jgi:hypothetical protein
MSFTYGRKTQQEPEQVQSNTDQTAVQAVVEEESAKAEEQPELLKPRVDEAEMSGQLRAFQSNIAEEKPFTGDVGYADVIISFTDEQFNVRPRRDERVEHSVRGPQGFTLHTRSGVKLMIVVARIDQSDITPDAEAEQEGSSTDATANQPETSISEAVTTESERGDS